MKLSKAKKETISNKNLYLVAYGLSILLIFTIFYFGMNLSWKTTHSSSTSYCKDGTELYTVGRINKDVCLLYPDYFRC